MFAAIMNIVAWRIDQSQRTADNSPMVAVHGCRERSRERYHLTNGNRSPISKSSSPESIHPSSIQDRGIFPKDEASPSSRLVQSQVSSKSSKKKKDIEYPKRQRTETETKKNSPIYSASNRHPYYTRAANLLSKNKSPAQLSCGNSVTSSSSASHSILI